MQEAKELAPAETADIAEPVAAVIPRKRRTRSDKGIPKKLATTAPIKTLVALVAASKESIGDIEVPEGHMCLRPPIVLKTSAVAKAKREMEERAQEDVTLQGAKVTFVLIKGKGVIEVEKPKRPKIIFRDA